MKYARLIEGAGLAGAVAFALWVGTTAVTGQQAPAGRVIQSLAEAGQGLSVRSESAQSGFVTFAASAEAGVLLPVPPGASAFERALVFVEQYGASFGVADRTQVRLAQEPEADSLGLEHVRLQQVHQGLPVRAGELLVHLRGERVVAANGRVAARLPEDVVPAVDAGLALSAARAYLEKHRPDQAAAAQYFEPVLEIFDRGLLEEGDYPARLAWFVEARALDLREYIWVDAKAGVVLLGFSQLAELRIRRVHNMGGAQAPLPGTLVRSEGGAATGDADTDAAYDHAGITYDYFSTQHGRDSYDGAGAAIISSVHYGTLYRNAFWNGIQMVYGDGYAGADDVVGHELTHALTERSANLLYYNQSGALNESFSDIFGEVIDLTDGVGNDSAAARWLLGEDLPIGAIRNMASPEMFGQPGRMSDSTRFFCSDQGWTSNTADRGGVHRNSGIPNHAFVLMVDGGTYNSQTITGIGLAKAAQIQYRALTTYLTSGSGFLDAFNAVNQACTDLVGTSGITGTDCTQVRNAQLAVEMNTRWPCAGATAAPALCPAGTPTAVFTDGFETGSLAWAASSVTPNTWLRSTTFARTGRFSVHGTDGTATFSGVSDHRYTSSAHTIPAGGRMYFDHAFEFETAGATNYDGGVLEYSTDGGAAWVSAAPLIDAGQGYNGTLDATTSNPLGGLPAFVRSSFGFTGTRLDLASLAGQAVRFRFRIGTDASVGSMGWYIDNVTIYSCAVPAPAPGPAISGFSPASVRGGTGPFTLTVLGANFVSGASVTWNGSPRATTFVSVTELRATIPGADIAAGASAPTVGVRNPDGQTASAPYTVTTSWRVCGAGDLNRDGRSDLVWESADGYIAAWLMNGLNQASNVLLYDHPVAVDGWSCAAVGDLNGDGFSDLVWQNANGFVAGWIMNGTTQVANSLLYSYPVAVDGWSIVAAGDLDGDSRADLLWQDQRGYVAVWFMDGLTQRYNTLIDPRPIAAGWSIAGTGDFSKDGSTDLVWQSNTGLVAAWLMAGGTQVSSVLFLQTPIAVGGWNIAAVGDLNADASADLVWLKDDGLLAAWLMNGTVQALNAPLSPGRVF